MQAEGWRDGGMEGWRTNVLGPFCHWALKEGNILVSILSYFNPVVEDSKHWSQWEGRNKNGYKAILDH